MKLLDRHVLKELIGPFLFGVAAFTSLMLAGKELSNLIELVVEANAPISAVVKLLVLQMPAIIVLTLPMSMLLATLLGFGRLSSDSETVALFAGGISLYRIAVPVIMMSIVVTGASFVLSEVVMPKTSTLHEKIISELQPGHNPKKKPFPAIDSDGNTIKSVSFIRGGFDEKNNAMRDVWMLQYSNNEPSVFIYGKRVVWKGKNEWSFQNGYWQSVGRETVKNGQTMMMSFVEQTVKIDKTPDQIALYKRYSEELSFGQLLGFIRMLEKDGQDANEYKVRLYEKISMPLASLIFALIGTPLGLRPQRSSSAMGLGLSIVIIFAYWILLHYMTILGEGGSISPIAAAFVPTLIGAAVGVALIIRAAK